MRNILLRALSALVLIATAHATTVSIQYHYDDAGRLTQAVYDDTATITYVYDANGNLLQRTVTDGEVIYTLIYRAGTGGSISGVATQVVAAGQSGTAISAVVEDADAVFGRWSDGNISPARTDANVQSDLTVQASFRSTGGADLDWYTDRNIAPEAGETWADVDARPVPGKGTTLRQENIAGTDPADPEDRFEIIAIHPGPPPTITYRLGSAERVYTLFSTDNLVSNLWTHVPGAGPHPGSGSVVDTNEPPAGLYYRMEVDLP